MQYEIKFISKDEQYLLNISAVPHHTLSTPYRTVPYRTVPYRTMLIKKFSRAVAVFMHSEGFKKFPKTAISFSLKEFGKKYGLASTCLQNYCTVLYLKVRRTVRTHVPYSWLFISLCNDIKHDSVESLEIRNIRHIYSKETQRSIGTSLIYNNKCFVYN